MKTSSPSLSSEIDILALRDTLSPLLPILDAFNHRHKNQHHASHWWSHLSILRRSLRLLLTSRRHTLSRARWLTTRTIPRAYVPITQLAADNQYAPLGLALLTVLARINAAVSQHLPPPDSEKLRDPAPTPAAAPPSLQPVESDMGIAVSRGSVGPKLPSPRESARHDKSPLTADAEERPKDKKKKKSKSKKTQKGDDFSNLFSSL